LEDCFGIKRGSLRQGCFGHFIVSDEMKRPAQISL
jgi:hypothetical protein